jgi:hypothetical protein
MCVPIAHSAVLAAFPALGPAGQRVKEREIRVIAKLYNYTSSSESVQVRANAHFNHMLKVASAAC